MDLELMGWIVFFVGGYAMILGYLLRIAMRGRPGGPAS
jgi:hypothetical protein